MQKTSLPTILVYVLKPSFEGLARLADIKCKWYITINMCSTQSQNLNDHHLNTMYLILPGVEIKMQRHCALSCYGGKSYCML